MTLKLGPIANDKPVRMTLEIPQWLRRPVTLRNRVCSGL